MKRIWIPQVLVSIMLIWAFYPNNSYGYYILLRWVCCPACAYLAIQALDKKKIEWVWVLGVTAIIYNPIKPIHLSRGLWTFVNLATIVIAISSIVVLKVPKEDPD